MSTINHPLGNLIRLLPLMIDELPAHPAFTDSPKTTEMNSQTPSQQGSTRPRLRDFILSALTEANTFVSTTLPGTFTTVSTSKISNPATAKIKLMKRMIAPSELTTTSRAKADTNKVEGEAWFARTSIHANSKEKGTAEWTEFDEGLRVQHSEHEREYTPDVYDSNRVLGWDEETRGLDLGGQWTDVDMRIYEMAHAIPAPLKPRVFPVLIITARGPSNSSGDSANPRSLLVVQIPVDISRLSQALYSNGRNVREGDSPQKRKPVVMGVYASVEKAFVREDGQVEWTTTTASNAKGWLPVWAQKMGVPGAVIKDVGLFIAWVAKRRKTGGQNGGEPAS